MNVVQLELEEEARAAILRLNRPAAHNVVDDRVMLALEDHLELLSSQPQVLTVILTGAGRETFSAGGDLDYFTSIPSREDALAMSRRMQEILGRFWGGPRFSIAAINGQALGGGCEMLTACHYRIAVQEATFTFVQARKGLTPGWGGGTRLIAQIGRSRALELLLSGRTVPAEEALGLGLIDRVVPAADLLEASLEKAAEVSKGSPEAVRSILKLARAMDAAIPASARDLELSTFGDRWISKEFREVLAKRVSRRKRT